MRAIKRLVRSALRHAAGAVPIWVCSFAVILFPTSCNVRSEHDDKMRQSMSTTTCRQEAPSDAARAGDVASLHPGCDAISWSNQDKAKSWMAAQGGAGRSGPDASPRFATVN